MISVQEMLLSPDALLVPFLALIITHSFSPQFMHTEVFRKQPFVSARSPHPAEFAGQ